MPTVDYAAKAAQLAKLAEIRLTEKSNTTAPHYIALAQVWADLAKTTGPRIPKDTIVAYPNQSGAIVAVTEIEQAGRTTYPWRCGGCPAGHDGYSTIAYAQEAAKRHAGQCNALPIPA